MSHFLLIQEGSYDASTIYGIYESFDDARNDAEKRTAAKDEIQRQSRANRIPGQLGDPGPYVPHGDYGIEMAQIQQWENEKLVAYWERSYKNPLDWRKY